MHPLHLLVIVSTLPSRASHISRNARPTMSSKPIQTVPKLSLPAVICPYCSGALDILDQALALDTLEILSELPFEKSTRSLSQDAHWLTRLYAKLSKAFKVCSTHHTNHLPPRRSDSAVQPSTGSTDTADKTIPPCNNQQRQPDQ